MCYYSFCEHVYKREEPMPKILEEVRTRAIQALRNQIAQGGFEKATMRSIASELGISAATLYHYFASKEDLIAAMIVEDWKPVSEKIREEAEQCPDAEEVCAMLYTNLLAFSSSHQSVFSSLSSSDILKDQGPGFHSRLVSIMKDMILEKMEAKDERAVQCAEGCAELLLAGVREKRNYESMKFAINTLTGGKQ